MPRAKQERIVVAMPPESLDDLRVVEDDLPSEITYGRRSIAVRRSIATAAECVRRRAEKESDRG